MKKNLINIGAKGLGMLSALSPFLALAQSYNLPTSKVNTQTDVITLICSLAGWLFAILIALSVILIIYAAFLYLIAAGNEEKVTKANHTLIYAAVGIIVAILAKAVPVIVGSVFAQGGVIAC